MTTSVTVSWFWFVRLFFVVFFSYWLVDGSFCFHFRSGFSLNKNRFYLTSSSLKMQIFSSQKRLSKEKEEVGGGGGGGSEWAGLSLGPPVRPATNQSPSSPLGPSPFRPPSIPPPLCGGGFYKTKKNRSTIKIKNKLINSAFDRFRMNECNFFLNQYGITIKTALLFVRSNADRLRLMKIFTQESLNFT